MHWVRTCLARLSLLLASWAGVEEEGAAEPVRRQPLTLDGNPLATEVRLRLDRMRTLRWTTLESARFYRQTGISCIRDRVNPLEWDEDQFALFLACAASSEDPEIAKEDLQPFLHGEKVAEALAAAFVLLGDFAPSAPRELEEERSDIPDPLMAGALMRLMTSGTGRSPRRSSGSGLNTGPLPRA